MITALMSTSRFSREFKRFFGEPPSAIARQSRAANL